MPSALAIFVLLDIPIITTGRSRDCLLQFKGQAALRISRFHIEFHRSRQSSSRYKQLWQIRDPGSASGVFLNGGRIPPKKLIRLCDNDIIEVGGNFTEEEIKKSLSKSYLFRLVAPEIGVKNSQKRHNCHVSMKTVFVHWMNSNYIQSRFVLKKYGN